MKKILLDTNFLLVPFQFNVDIFSEIERLVTEKFKLCTLKKCIWELEHIMRTAKKGKDRLNAKMALQLVKKYNIEIIDTPLDRKTDDLIVEIAKENPREWIVCTNDKELRRMLKKLGITTIFLRQKKYLEIEEA